MAAEADAVDVPPHPAPGLVVLHVQVNHHLEPVARQVVGEQGYQTLVLSNMGLPLSGIVVGGLRIRGVADEDTYTFT